MMLLAKEISQQARCLYVLYRKFETYIPRNRTVRPRSQFLYSCIWKRSIYSHDRSNLESPFFLYCVRELLAQPNEQMSGEGQGTAAKQWLVAVPCPTLRTCS